MDFLRVAKLINQLIPPQLTRTCLATKNMQCEWRYAGKGTAIMRAVECSSCKAQVIFTSLDPEREVDFLMMTGGSDSDLREGYGWAPVNASYRIVSINAFPELNLDSLFEKLTVDHGNSQTIHGTLTRRRQRPMSLALKACFTFSCAVIAIETIAAILQ